MKKVMKFYGGDWYIHAGRDNENILWIRNTTDQWVKMFDDPENPQLGPVFDHQIERCVFAGGTLVRNGRVLTDVPLF